MSKIKRLFFDIETSPNIGLFWASGYKLNIGYESIIKERAIICIAYKWAGEKQTHVLTWDKNQNDKQLLLDFIKIANTADELVAHNGDKFDLPWIRTRCLFHRIPAFPHYVTIDTLKSSRSKFRFNSNRLDYIAQFLGVGKKIHTGYDLWKDIVLNKSQKALDKMAIYCKGDVVILEKIFDILVNYIPAKVHHGVILGGTKGSCPECGSENMKLSQRRYTAAGTERIQLKCECGKFHTVSAKVYGALKK